jgi:hypothetical protein
MHPAPSKTPKLRSRDLEGRSMHKKQGNSAKKDYKLFATLDLSPDDFTEERLVINDGVSST